MEAVMVLVCAFVVIYWNSHSFLWPNNTTDIGRSSRGGTGSAGKYQLSNELRLSQSHHLDGDSSHREPKKVDLLVPKGMNQSKCIVGPALKGCSHLSTSSTYTSIVKDDDFTCSSKAVE
jgi:hypothetical protein